MLAVEQLYDAAAHAGLLTPARIGDIAIMVDFRAPDEDVLGGLALARDYSIRLPRSRLPGLASGDSVLVGEQIFRVREITALGDGSEMRASLTRL